MLKFTEEERRERDREKERGRGRERGRVKEKDKKPLVGLLLIRFQGLLGNSPAALSSSQVSNATRLFSTYGTKEEALSKKGNWRAPQLDSSV